MKRSIKITLISFLFLISTACANKKQISMDLSLFDDFLNYSNIETKYNVDVHFEDEESYNKEQCSKQLNIVGKDFSIIYEDTEKSGNFYVSLVKFKNPEFKLRGISLIGKSSEEIQKIFVYDDSAVSLDISSDRIYYYNKNLSGNPFEHFGRPFYILFILKNNKVIRVSLGFDK